ncbi:hypothetical protein QM012_005617 [Aureobasidium pullulans]|uniref:Cytochrome P450 n=1 Tax=Aureobasidium pullulans TaxID=5580 RepID=A0ABR0T4N4_AURPU
MADGSGNGLTIAELAEKTVVEEALLSDYEHVLLALHRKHGKIVRIGPNHINISDASAVKTVYGSGRNFKKSSFYDAFTALRPNLFGTRNEEIHSARRKAVANSFSAQSVASMEVYMDICMHKLIAKLDVFAEQRQAVDLKKWISFFLMDVLGELAFSRPFGVLEKGDEALMPPTYEHVLLATLSGQVPWCIPYVRKVLPYVPIPSLSRMIKERDHLRQMAIESVEKRIATPSDRKDLLGRLIEECETGQDSKGTSMDIVDVQTEAFEIDALDLRPEGTASYPFQETNQLSYLQAVVTEGFRLNPVFTMALLREVPKGGTVIAGECIPEGTDVSICNHVLHHDEQVFGPSLEQFDPERWMDAEYDCTAYLIPFGSGHRACVGRNIATAEIQKLVVSLLARYDITLADAPGTSFEQSTMPPTRSFGVADLDGHLTVKLKRR